MTIVDLGRFASQFATLEQSNLQLERHSLRLKPNHINQQPVHVLYGGAHMFNALTVEKLSRLALESFDEFIADGANLMRILGESWTTEFANDIYTRVRRKLTTRAIEDYRIDFEDGYGVRTDDEEDLHARESALALVKAIQSDAASPKMGIRIKPLSTVGMRRSIRTLVAFVESFCNAGGKNTSLHHLTITLPKVTSAHQIEALVEILEQLESEQKLAPHFFMMELLIETPEALLAVDGKIPLPSFLEAARGRCGSLHFGIYDFTSSLGIGSAGQAIDHPACDFARLWMQITASLSPGIGISDGIINILPIPKHREKQKQLTSEQMQENQASLEEAWRYNYQQMMRSLKNGFYQGWDLHPTQVPIRHIANHVYVLKEFPSAIKRMIGFLDRSAQANRVGTLFDDRASVLGLINFAERAITSGILSLEDFSAQGVDIHMLKSMI